MPPMLRRLLERIARRILREELLAQRAAAIAKAKHYRKLTTSSAEHRARQTREKNAEIKRFRESRDTWKKKAHGFEQEAKRLRAELKEGSDG